MSDDRVRVCRVDELPPGRRRIIEASGRSIGVFNIAGEFYALLNRCPHRGAPLCEGRVTGLVRGDRPGEFRLERDGEVIKCPWHGWEFDITTGQSVFNPHRVRARRYPVDVEPDTDPDECVPWFPAYTDKGWVVVTVSRVRAAASGPTSVSGPPA